MSIADEMRAGADLPKDSSKVELWYWNGKSASWIIGKGDAEDPKQRFRAIVLFSKVTNQLWPDKNSPIESKEKLCVSTDSKKGVAFFNKGVALSDADAKTLSDAGYTGDCRTCGLAQFSEVHGKTLCPSGYRLAVIPLDAAGRKLRPDADFVVLNAGKIAAFNSLRIGLNALTKPDRGPCYDWIIGFTVGKAKLADVPRMEIMDRAPALPGISLADLQVQAYDYLGKSWNPFGDHEDAPKSEAGPTEGFDAIADDDIPF